MSGFTALLRQASSGTTADRERAYAEMLRFVRIVVRAEMGRKLRDHRESADVCQSIAKSFVDDLQSGRVEFESERALAAYLRLAVRNKLAELARHDGALKRGGGNRASSAPELLADETEPESLAGPDWAQVREGLDEEERTLVELRLRGLDWEQVARELGSTPIAARQRYSRIVRRLRARAAGG